MDVLRRTAQIVSEHFGIEVIFRGSEAFTDGRTIVVPSLAEDAPDDLIEAIIGYIDHEVGHVMDTDFTVLARNDVEIAKDPRKKLIVNAVEDIRQEHINGQRYRGVGLNLEFTEEWTLRKIDAKWEAKDPDPMEIPPFNRFCLVSMARAKMIAGHPYAKEWYEKWVPLLDVEEIIEALDDEIETWHALESTQEAWDAGLRVLDKLEEYKEMKVAETKLVKGPGGTLPPPDDEDDEEGEPGDGESGMDDVAEEDDLDKETPESPGESDESDLDESSDEDDEGEESKSGGHDDESEEDESDEDSEGSGSGDSEEEEESESGESDDEEEDGDDGSSGGDDGDDDDSEEDDEGEGAPANIAALTDKEVSVSEDDMHKFTQLEIGEGSGDSKGHRAYSMEFDRIITPEGDGNLEEYGKVLGDARAAVNVVYTVLTRTLLAQARTKTQYGRQDGKINTTAVGMLRAGSPSIFKRKRKGLKLNTYVEVIVDQSGSMSGYFSERGKSKIGLAQQTCIVLAEALNRIGVPFGICGFTCGFDSVGIPNEKHKGYEVFRGDVMSKGADFHRIEPLIEYRYKTAEEPLSKARPLLSLMRDQRMMNNADGDSILKIAKRVMGRKEKRKILIVLSDGYPAAQQGANTYAEGHDAAASYMKRVAQIIKGTPNLEVIGIGIESDSVSEYYDRHCVVNSIDDLPQIAMTKLKEALVPGIRAR
jgi:cobalamin biosynthesis protein CobT